MLRQSYTKHPQERGSALTILLVGLEEKELMTYLTHLESVEDVTMDCIPVGGMQDALDVMSACAIDVVLTRTLVEDTLATDFLDQVEQSHSDWQPPIVVLAKAGEEHHIEVLLTAGVEDYIFVMPEDKHLCLLPLKLQKVYQNRLLHYEKYQMDKLFWMTRHSNDVLMEAMQEGAVGLDKEGRVLFSNPQAAYMLGLPETQLLQRDILTVLKEVTVSPQEFDGVGTLVEDMREGTILEKRLKLRQFSFPNSGKEPLTRLVKVSCKPVRDQNGHVAGGVIVMEEVV